MRKLLSAIMILLLFCSTNNLCAQSEYFKVLVNKGNITVNGEKIKTGMHLGANDVIKLRQNCYLGLLHRSGRPLEIKDPGTYTVSDLQKKFGSIGDDPVYDDIRLRNPTKKSRLDGVGSVDRSKTPLIQIHHASGTYTIFAPITVMWTLDPSVELPDNYIYEVLVMNMFNDVFQTINTKQNSVVVDLTESRIDRENLVVIQVSLKSETTANTISEKTIYKKTNDHDSVRAKLFSSSKKHTFWASVAEECLIKELFANAIYAYSLANHLAGKGKYDNKLKEVISKLHAKPNIE